MHQRRYRCRVLLRCSSAAVACAGAIAAATDRHMAGRGARRKIDEGDRRAPTRRIDLSCSDGAPAETKSWEKRPATGRWRTKMGQRVDAAPPQTQELPERRPGELQRGVTGATKEPGEAGLARHLPRRAAERPISLLGSRGLVRGYSSSPGRRKPMRGLGSCGGFSSSFNAVNIICISSLFWKICLSSCSSFSRIS
jgi:hypothetical protein